MDRPGRPDWPAPDPHAESVGDGRLATATEWATSVDEVQEIVRRRVAEGLAIYPQGGCTALDYGGIPRRPGVALKLRQMGRVIDYPSEDLTITVEPGIRLAEIDEVLRVENQRLEIDAPLPDRATIGGVIATNSTGPRRYGCGRPRDQILGVSFVNGAGDLVKGGGRVVKNVAGYDFPRLLTGSMGTLGVITQVTLKVRPRPEVSAIVRVDHDDLQGVALDLDWIRASETRPVAIELRHLTRTFDPGQRGWLGGRAWGLFLGVEGNESAVAWQVEQARSGLKGAVTYLGPEDRTTSETWGYLRSQGRQPHGLEVRGVANVRPSEVIRMVAEGDARGWFTQSHAGTGVVEYVRARHDKDAIFADIPAFRALAEQGGGNLIVVSCPTEWKEALKVWGDPRPDWSWCERVKAALDPSGMMNPGRFVGTI